MDAPEGHSATQLLIAAQGGDVAARDRLVALMYEDMRPLARGILNGQRNGHTLSATALVHEVFLRMFRGDALSNISNRAHFLLAAAQAMR
jgi:DNA-directed RNA polymerase specialized sigma24 family protein